MEEGFALGYDPGFFEKDRSNDLLIIMLLMFLFMYSSDLDVKRLKDVLDAMEELEERTE